jgi:hypothetical protein
LAGRQLADWTPQIDAQYGALEAERQEGGPAAASRLVAPGQRFVPTASSFTLGAILSDETLGALLAVVPLQLPRATSSQPPRPATRVAAVDFANVYCRGSERREDHNVQLWAAL